MSQLRPAAVPVGQSDPGARSIIRRALRSVHRRGHRLMGWFVLLQAVSGLALLVVHQPWLAWLVTTTIAPGLWVYGARLRRSLQRSQTITQTLLDALPDPVFVKDREGRYILVNAAGACVTKLEPSQIVGRDVTALPATPETVASTRMADQDVLQSGKPRIDEMSFETADGSSTIIRITKSPWRDESGEIGGVVAVAQDITDRRRVEQALKESKSLFQSFMDNSPAVAFMKDEAGRYIYVNGVFERLFGMRLADLVGKDDFAVWTPEIARQFRENDLTVLEARRPLELLETTRHPDGLHQWLALKFPLETSPGKRAVAGLAVDVTRHKAAESALQKTTLELEALFDCSPLAICTVDTEIRVLSWNPAAERCFGWGEAEVLGRPPAIIPRDAWKENETLWAPRGNRAVSRGRVCRPDSQAAAPSGAARGRDGGPNR